MGRRIQSHFNYCRITQREVSLEEEQEVFEGVGAHDVILTTGRQRCHFMMACNTQQIRCKYSMTNSDRDPFQEEEPPLRPSFKLGWWSPLTKGS
ncbi:MAG: hypothetical protein HYY96_07065 [Candidatus Tectomicrobia bacterium]|nr:hypothetical protein [Candidatus Tectomicrobia bacterium]